jgi:hypothetical protein
MGFLTFEPMFPAKRVSHTKVALDSDPFAPYCYRVRKILDKAGR